MGEPAPDHQSSSLRGMNSRGLPGMRGQTFGEGRAFAEGGEELGGGTATWAASGGAEIGPFLSLESPSLTQ
jgi:hypothetical protein